MAKRRVAPPRKKIKQIEEKKREAPGYMMSFGDMMTLLLTFFILLVTLADEQQAGLVAAGTGSFIRALDAFGLPGFLPKSKNVIALGRMRPKFLLPRDQVKEKGKEQVGEKRIIKDRPKVLAPDDADISYSRKRPEIRMPLDIEFGQDLATLPASSRPALDNLVKLIRGRSYSVIVEGHAEAKEPPSKSEIRNSGWVLSAERAASVRRYLIASGCVTPDRISATGYGEFRPIVASAGGRRRKANDRIIVILRDDASSPDQN